VNCLGGFWPKSLGGCGLDLGLGGVCIGLREKDGAD
jgi:hypothetical protein